jgi:basic membrane lipoprotein Med (substrate-binding protein (PBP1-ABC) superfamily)
VDESILLAVQQAVAGTLPWGTRAVLGINENCIGLADNPIYQSVVPANVRSLILDNTKKIQANQIKVVSAFGMDQAAFTQFINAVRP